jgi:hypothetical protein
MPNELWMFLVNFFCHWGSLLTSGAFAVLLMIYEHWKNRNITWRNFILIMGLGLFVSCFLAWRDEHHNSEVLKLQKSDLTDKRNVLQARLDASQDEVAHLRDELSRRPPAARVEVIRPLKPEPLKPIERDELRAIPEEIPSGRNDAPFGLKVTIQSDKEIPQPTIEIECDNEITDGTVQAGMSAMAAMNVYTIGNRFRFTGVSPALSPGQPYTVILAGKQHLKLKAVRRIY